MSGRRLRAWIVGALASAGALACTRSHDPIRLPPVVVMSPYRLTPVVVHGAARGWWKLASRHARYGDPLPVGVTMYCLRGTTRRGRYVRAGIVAADPRYFPLARYIELYVGRTYLGRFLVDDTGKRIRGARIDVWTASCREARRFGLQRGTAVLVERPAIEVRQAGSGTRAK
ncbi:MAG TPA: 3D domain-containing protein [Gemmatimonadaceae bacterium]|nr:3D domain-containing protein [Gemmatimonadaceae bacterium]